MDAALSALEKFWHAPSPLPLIVRLALIHYQFEAIHPFLDGNGRIGRLLIILLLCAGKVLPQPMLYLSAYFERNRQDYYRHLLAVSQAGRWREWIVFFLRGVAEQSQDAVERSGRLLHLWQNYRRKLQSVRSPALALRLVDELFHLPFMSIGTAQRILEVTYPSARLNVEKLVRIGILEEATGKKYGRIFTAPGIIAILEEPITKHLR
jgi:Fic family protein